MSVFFKDFKTLCIIANKGYRCICMDLCCDSSGPVHALMQNYVHLFRFKLAYIANITTVKTMDCDNYHKNLCICIANT